MSRRAGWALAGAVAGFAAGLMARRVRNSIADALERWAERLDPGVMERAGLVVAPGPPRG